MTEGPIDDRGIQITIRGGDEPNVDTDRLRASNTFEFPFLEHPQERDLGLRQEFTDFVEEDRTAVGQLKTAKSALRGTGERALLVTE